MKLNDVQHELSLDVKQRMLYCLATICNTMSYVSLLVLLAINIFDFIPLLRDRLSKEDDEEDWTGLLNEGTSKVEFWAIYIMSMFPLMMKLV